MKIVNVRGMPPNAPGVVYCARTCGGWQGSPLGNPFKIGTDGTRTEVIAKYRTWLWQRLKANDQAVIQALDALEADSALGCWCAPLSCHCEVIASAWRWRQASK